MKPLLILLTFVLAVSVSAQTVKLTAESKGIRIADQNSASISLAAPVITGSDKKDRKPVFTPANDGASAIATYPDGFVIHINLSSTDGTITYRFSQAPADALSVRVNASLPVTEAEGGSFATNGGAAQPFPSEVGKQLFAQGAFTQVDLVTGAGSGFSFNVPSSYQQLQDNRIWGTQTFSWIYHHDFLRYPDRTSFSIRVAAIQKK